MLYVRILLGVVPLIFSQAGTSAVFLWVPFPFGILLTFGKENTFSLLSLNCKILSPPKEMEHNYYKTEFDYRKCREYCKRLSHKGLFHQE